MINLWQLKKLSTNESLNEPQKLPENWGPIFGLAGIQDRIGDLSWLGEAYADQGWVIVGEAPDDNSQSTVSDIAWNRAKQMLKESDWAVLSDVPMTAGVKAQWIEYRKALRDVRLQTGFPNSINWPNKPE
jgi:hypothetical protein